MPIVGEIKRGWQIGYALNREHIWHACVDCGRERWVQLTKNNPHWVRCPPCAQKRRRKPLPATGTVSHPMLGDQRRGWEIGSTQRKHIFIWAACQGCGRERWARFVKNEIECSHCRSCARRLSSGKRWETRFERHRGHKCKRQGYVLIYVPPSDFFRPMANQWGKILEHRLVMAQHLGRCLHSWEIVHHKNGIKDDNRIENLQLVSDDRHKQITILVRRVEQLEGKVSDQGKLIRLLQWQIKELREELKSKSSA